VGGHSDRDQGGGLAAWIFVGGWIQETLDRYCGADWIDFESRRDGMEFGYRERSFSNAFKEAVAMATPDDPFGDELPHADATLLHLIFDEDRIFLLKLRAAF